MSETQRDDAADTPTPIVARVHRSKVGTYHPARRYNDGDPTDDVCEYPAWTINDTRGYTDVEIVECDCE